MKLKNADVCLFLGLVLCLGCVSIDDVGKDATLRCTIMLRTADGAPLADYPILASTRSLHLDPASRVVFTDAEGRIDLIETRTPNPETFALHAAVRQEESFYFYLPEVHSEGMYSITFLMDPEHPRWAEIDKERAVDAPDRIEPVPAERTNASVTVFRHGAQYDANTGAYLSTWMLSDGSDRRRVPMTRMPYGMGPVPRHPKLEVEARAAPLVGERGYQLHLELTLLDSPDVAVARAELLDSLRRILELVATGKPLSETDRGRLDITLLVGAGRQALLDALGEPAYCIARQTLDDQGDSRPYVPCSTGDSDAVYRFYHPSRSRRGGRPELHLRFNSAGRCNSTRWDLAQ